MATEAETISKLLEELTKLTDRRLALGLFGIDEHELSEWRSWSEQSESIGLKELARALKTCFGTDVGKQSSLRFQIAAEDWGKWLCLLEITREAFLLEKLTGSAETNKEATANHE